MIKRIGLLVMVFSGLLITSSLYSQVEVKGSGSTSATNTFITKNSSNDTSLLVRDDGFIGLGTTSPGARLDIFGRGLNNLLLSVRNDIASPADSSIFISPRGNLGIGISTPGAYKVKSLLGSHAFANQLEVWSNDPAIGTSRLLGDIGDFGGLNGYLNLYQNGVLGIQLRTGGASYFTSGPVGIGTTTPATPLEVNGLIYSSAGGYQFPDGTIQTTAAAGGGVAYANVFTVAQSGGDFTSIVNALAACVSPSPSNRYLIRVMPGTYNEPTPVFCKKFVDMSGSGKYSSVINQRVIGADSCVIENFYIAQGISCVGTSPFILHNIITNQSADQSEGIYVISLGPDSIAKPWIKENEIVDCLGFGITCSQPGTDAWILANKILRNNGGGIDIFDCAGTISNNIIDSNMMVGINIFGNEGFGADPTIDDNVISHTGYQQGGFGIYMDGYCEPRIGYNDIYVNECGICVGAVGGGPNTFAQPSIVANNINYNYEAGIRCFSNGLNKPTVITGNHIHSNCPGGMSGANPAGIWIDCSNVVVASNVVINNDRSGGAQPDIFYVIPNIPVISNNIVDIINSGSGAAGQYNSTSLGLPIAP